MIINIFNIDDETNFSVIVIHALDLLSMYLQLQN